MSVAHSFASDACSLHTHPSTVNCLINGFRGRKTKELIWRRRWTRNGWMQIQRSVQSAKRLFRRTMGAIGWRATPAIRASAGFAWETIRITKFGSEPTEDLAMTPRKWDAKAEKLTWQKTISILLNLIQRSTSSRKLSKCTKRQRKWR